MSHPFSPLKSRLSLAARTPQSPFVEQTFEPDVYALTVFVAGNGEFKYAAAKGKSEARLFITEHSERKYALDDQDYSRL